MWGEGGSYPKKYRVAAIQYTPQKLISASDVPINPLTFFIQSGTFSAPATTAKLQDQLRKSINCFFHNTLPEKGMNAENCRAFRDAKIVDKSRKQLGICDRSINFRKNTTDLRMQEPEKETGIRDFQQFEYVDRKTMQLKRMQTEIQRNLSFHEFAIESYRITWINTLRKQEVFGRHMPCGNLVQRFFQWLMLSQKHQSRVFQLVKENGQILVLKDMQSKAFTVVDLTHDAFKGLLGLVKAVRAELAAFLAQLLAGVLTRSDHLMAIGLHAGSAPNFHFYPYIDYGKYNVILVLPKPYMFIASLNLVGLVGVAISEVALGAFFFPKFMEININDQLVPLE